MRLTKKKIDALKYKGANKKSHIVFDDEIPGFAIRVYPSGAKSFLIDYRLNGRQRRMVIGQYGKITLDQARKIAKKKLVEVMEGIDPLENKNKSKNDLTVEDLSSLFIQEYSKKHKKSWGEDERRLRNHIIPAIGKMRLHTVKRSDIAKFHNKIGENHPYEANRNLALLSVMFEYARKNGLLTEEYANPARGITKFREQKRDRWVKPEEMPQLIKAINNNENIYVRSALWLYLLTGVRKNELLKAQWKDVDFNNGQMKLFDTKNGTNHYVSLSKAALEILKEIPRLQGNPYILPGRKAGKHLVNINIPWRKVRMMAGLEDVRLHDLRRTVGSMLANAGHSLQLVGKVLNHADMATTQKVYAHLSQDPIKLAMEQHGEILAGYSRDKDE